MGDKYENTATGQSQVTFQIGRMDGTLTVHSQPEGATDLAELHAEIQRLRQDLELAIRRGELDPDLTDAALSSMKVVEKVNLGAGELAEKKPKLLVGLTALAATVSGLAGLSDAVGGLIDAVQRIA